MPDSDLAGSYLIVGASRGLGAAVAEWLAPRVDKLFTASRSPASHGTWIEADVATDEGLDDLRAAIGSQPLDGLLFLGGTWEKGAFTADYDFSRSPRSEIRAVIAVNLTAPILLAQSLAGNLAKAPNPRVVFIGALSGLDNAATVEVANTASKFGLRGAAQALALALRPQGIGVTVINPGNLATPEVLEDIASGAFGAQVPIPLEDLIRTLDYLLSLSADAVPQDINLMQKRPDHA
ncbi:SDR family NAD(P)-dependent oxidoreductase [Algihabitans albus]|uniref:SDR family NAD(P)-dependent oxidoreductase n=1 Tax=Algihabitans albus TaxID=2164067 RepID=UPI000E5D4BD5|nr:SDR family oxidoreductase [Algihabitans albus]